MHRIQWLLEGQEMVKKTSNFLKSLEKEMARLKLSKCRMSKMDPRAHRISEVLKGSSSV